MSGLWSVAIWMYSFFFIWKSVQYFLEIRRLSHVREFFIHLLDIPEQDMQTVSWQDIVARVMALRDQNPKTATNIPRNLRRFIGSQSKERLDAHDIANRLMRKDNYLIAMINKDLLDLSLPAPFMRGRSLLSKTMEWNLQFCILDMAFNELGQVQQDFLRADRRGVLSQKLRQRFFFAGCLNLIFAPVVLAYVVIVYFFTYYNVGALFPPSPFSRNAADTAILRSIRRTPNSRQRASTHDLQNGNSGNSTSFLISSMNALICLYLLRRDMSINSLSA
jgi:autophagy-related protein 9